MKHNAEPRTFEETYMDEEVKKPKRFIRKETFEVEEFSDWDAAADSRFGRRVPKKIHRTVITVSQRELIVERSGVFFKVIGHLSDFILLLFTAAMIGAAITMIIIAGRVSGAF